MGMDYRQTGRVLIVDDGAPFRLLLKSIVEERYDVVGEASNGGTAVQMAEQLRPDIVTLDISLPDMSGFEAAQRIRERVPNIRIILVSNHENRYYIDAALKRGADGYVVKGAALQELPNAIQSILNRAA